jgi:hypothetical protein
MFELTYRHNLVSTGRSAFRYFQDCTKLSDVNLNNLLTEQHIRLV